MSFFINRFKKCRVDNNVYKDKDEVDNELDDAKKYYALYKIIYFIKNGYKNRYKNNIRNTKGIAMDKLKNITNNCNSIIEKWFDLPDYLFKQKVFQQQIYYILNIRNFNFKNFLRFFSSFNLLNEKYIKEDDDEAIIFKLSCLNGTTYIRLSKKDLKNPQSNNYKIKIYRIYETLDSNDSLYGYMLMDEKNFKIYATTSYGSRTEQTQAEYTFDKISINNQQLANDFNKQQLANDFNKQQRGGIGKKTIKTKSKPFKNTILQKKEIHGKDMRIYKINGSKKEYVKYKGNLISVSDYKKIIKLKKLNNFLLY